MKEINWNIGILIIRIGYLTRVNFPSIGRFILRSGYKVRGEIPQKLWKGNHIQDKYKPNLTNLTE